MMNEYIYLCLGIVLGIAISLYYFASREEKIVKKINANKKNSYALKTVCVLTHTPRASGLRSSTFLSASCASFERSEFFM